MNTTKIRKQKVKPIFFSGKTTILIIITIFSLKIFAQTNETTTTFKVYGNCDMCKAKIEKVAKNLDGVKSGEWNKDTKIFTLVYDSSKISADGVHKKIASVGYDTEKVRAEDKVYKKLSGCCQYERNPNLNPTKPKNESSIKTVKFNVSGMTCQKGCADRIQNTLYKQKGVKECEVNFDKGIATIVYDEKKIKKEEFVKIIEQCSTENESIEPYKAEEIK